MIQLGLELLKMALHPVRYSRGVVEMINDFQEQLAAMAAMPPPMPAPGIGHNGGPPMEAGPPNGAGGPPRPGNGAMPPPPMM